MVVRQRLIGYSHRPDKKGKTCMGFKIIKFCTLEHDKDSVLEWACVDRIFKKPFAHCVANSVV